MIRNQLQTEKIKNVILYIAQNFKDGVDYIKLFKILYFAQQAQLVRLGKVLVNDNFKAQKHGPVPSYIYKALRVAENDRDNPNFKDFLFGIEVRDKKVYTTVKPNMDYLSNVDKGYLDAAIKEYKDVDSYTLSELSHDQAWESAMTRMQDDPEKNFISIIDIARAGNASEDMIDYIREKLLFIEALS